MNPRHYLKAFNSGSIMSKNENSHNFKSDHPQTVEFEEYLRTQHQEPSQSDSQSVDYRQQSDTNQRQEENISSNDQIRNKNLIEIGQNYTFAEEMSSQRKQYLKSLIFNDLPPIGIKKRHESQCSQNQMQNHPELNLDSSDFTQQYPRSQSQFSSQKDKHQKQISLSDNEEDQGVTIYNSKTIQEEMFLKISEQTKQILSLQQKLYYYEDLCKRLLKGHEEDKQEIEKSNFQLIALKKKSKEKSQKIKQLEKKLQQKEKYLQQKQKQLYQKSKALQQKQKEVKILIQTQKRFKKQQQSQLKRKAQEKILSQKQNIQEITYLQAEKKLINEKYQILLTNYDKITSKSILLQAQIQSYEKQNQMLKKKNKNLQNVNKILEKQIQELNLKIFKFQREMEEITCRNYASNLTRIKCMTQTSPDKFSVNKSSKFSQFDTVGFMRR